MYPRSFLCKEAKIKPITSSKNERYEIGRKAIWESWLTCFLNNKRPHFEQGFSETPTIKDLHMKTMNLV